MLLTNRGSPVFVGLPAKDLMICWSADLADQAAMIRAVEAAAQDLPYPLSSRIDMLTDDGVVGCPASTRGSQSTNRETQLRNVIKNKVDLKIEQRRPEIVCRGVSAFFPARA